MIEILLRDQTTGKNILWANAEFGAKEIQPDDIYLIKPRWEKIREHQKQRTRDRAEIFTPPEVCKIQNDLITSDKKSWQDYIDAKYLEITCGEAPYLVNRYNAVTGEPIPINQRTGLLDRKLSVVCEKNSSPEGWANWTIRALKSVYGYELQGDSLFLSRRNVFDTVVEYFMEKFPDKSYKLSENFLREVATIISWNLWQMDGLTYSPPFTDNANLFGGVNCKIKDWKKDEPFEFVELKGGRR